MNKILALVFQSTYQNPTTGAIREDRVIWSSCSDGGDDEAENVVSVLASR